jgi:hypothetical protein
MWIYQLVPFVIAFALAALSPLFTHFEQDRIKGSIRNEFSEKEKDVTEDLLENLFDHFQYSHDLLEMLSVFVVAIFSVLSLRLSEISRLGVVDIILVAALFFVLLSFVLGFRYEGAHKYCTNLKLKYYRFVPSIAIFVNLAIIIFLVLEHFFTELLHFLMGFIRVLSG